MQLKVINSPFDQRQTEELNRLLSTLTDTQKIWLSGYLAAPMKAEAVVAPSDAIQTSSSLYNTSDTAVREVTILFGSETGNCEELANDLSRQLKEKEFKVQLSAMDDFKSNHLKKVQDLLIITATHGEGDPPDNAISFHEFLHSRKAPKLKDVRFSVLSLGDQSYEFFCQTGKDFDKRLEELGGKRLHPRVDCDVDFDEMAAKWVEGVLDELSKSSRSQSVKKNSFAGQIVLPEEKPAYSRTHPFKAEVLENLSLSGRGSNKENRHLELSLEGSNLQFKPGDSLGIFPENDPDLVDELITEMNWNPEESVPINKQGDVRSLRVALLSHFEMTVLTKPLLEKAVKFVKNTGLATLLEPGHEKELRDYMEGRDLLDLVQDYPFSNIRPGEFVQILRKIPARLYSIASSYKANPDEVHLTIGTVRYKANGRNRMGVCSGQCAHRIKPGDVVPVYVHRNPNFKFPVDPDTPVIMIGPGTGVAPYRSFLEEREEEEVKGQTWLFFGDQHFDSDFLYQVDWQSWLEEGVLSRMDVAFSRDSAEKVYVQHRMLEKSRDFYSWLEKGAHVYVCGDEKHMAKDVHATLVTILEREGGFAAERAEAYLAEMRRQKRYQRDVY